MTRRHRSHSAIRLLAGLLLAIPLAACGTGYQREGNQMVFVTWDEGSGKVAHPIPGADVGSFIVLHSGYAKDKRQIYYNGRSVWADATHQPSAAQLAAFAWIDYAYAKDDQFAYYKGWPFRVDLATFRVGTQGNWSADKTDIYFQTQALHACDPGSFESLDSGGYWYRDARCVYANWDEKLVKLPQTIDPKTFAVVNYAFGVDGQHVYTHEGAVLPGVDPKEFAQTGKDAYPCTRNDQPAACNWK